MAAGLQDDGQGGDFYLALVDAVHFCWLSAGGGIADVFLNYAWCCGGQDEHNFREK